MAKLWETLLTGLGILIIFTLVVGIGFGFYYVLFVIAKKVFLGD